MAKLPYFCQSDVKHTTLAISCNFNTLRLDRAVLMTVACQHGPGHASIHQMWFTRNNGIYPAVFGEKACQDEKNMDVPKQCCQKGVKKDLVPTG